ncbi:MAG: peroxiredoxin family protein [Victivallaceae bacterium]|nr:peroxiredoxin family protein [Victivallaceae bacterium]
MRRLAIAAAALAAVELLALNPGDRALELSRTQWMKGGGFSTTVRLKSRGDTPAPLRVVVFVLTRAANTEDSTRLLESLQESLRNRIKMAIISPDSQEDMADYVRKISVRGLSVGRDRDRLITPGYMESSMMYPKAFIIGTDGIVIWAGEVADLGEALDKALSDKLNLGVQKKLTPLLDELQTAIRSNSLREMTRVTDEILEIDPGNAAAIRATCFTLESFNRADDAWKLVFREIDRQPKLTRLYLTAVDIVSRHPELANRLDDEVLLSKFERNISDPAACGAMAMNLLEKFPFSAKAIEYSAKLLSSYSSSSAEKHAGYWTAMALLHYRLGMLDKAAEDEDHVAELSKKSGFTQTETEARKRAEFYRSLVNLRKNLPDSPAK